MLTLTTGAAYRGLAVMLIALSVTACGYRRTMTFRSPSDRASIEFWQTTGFHPAARVELVSGARRAVLDRVATEAIFTFVHVHWSPDESRVGVLATGFNFVEAAYDIRTGMLVPFDEIRAELAKSIEKTYDVPPGEDPIRWPASADAGVAFGRLHPDARASAP